MNGLFQLVCTEQETILKLIPPVGEGASIDINEIVSYLQAVGIYDVDMKAIYSAVKNLKETTDVKLGVRIDYKIREMALYRFSEDAMYFIGRFYPPSNGGMRMTTKEIVKDITERKIKSGIDEAAIQNFLENPVYCTDIVLARGEEAVPGEDARIQYAFQTNISARPTRKPDGSVDFFHLNTINHCKEGDLLATLIPEVRGKPGCNLLGETIMPAEVRTKKLKYGKHVLLSEDEKSLISEINGHVSLAGDTVFVSDVYEVENIGPSTGNIDSEGSVVVNGNVQAGYSIRASGNVIVKGVVEGAEIEAGGDIIVACGMNGMGKGVLRAKGSVISKFFENTTVYSDSFVEADAILHSTIIAQTEINVDGRKGFIVGGSVRATNKVSCRTLGSSMGVSTSVEVGIDPQKKLKYQALQKELVEIKKGLKSTQPVIMGLTKKLKAGVKFSPEQIKYFQMMVEKNAAMTDRLLECENEYDFLDEQIQGNHKAMVCVREDVYSDTKISIQDASLTLKKAQSYCRFVYEKGEVKIMSY